MNPPRGETAEPVRRLRLLQVFIIGLAALFATLNPDNLAGTPRLMAPLLAAVALLAVFESQIQVLKGRLTKRSARFLWLFVAAAVSFIAYSLGS